MLGGKNSAGVYQLIINLMPPHDTYIEPFLGSGAVMRQKAPAIRSLGIDLDPRMVRDFHCDYPVTTFQADALGWLRIYKPIDRTLIYCDPPYVQSTRSSPRTLYDYELDDGRQEDLLNILRRLRGCEIMISGYQCGLYNRMLPDWQRIDYQAMTHGGVRTECLWLNFNPGEMHYHTFAGKTFGQRQNIKRKAARWAARFKAMPTGERQAVLAAMLADPE